MGMCGGRSLACSRTCRAVSRVVDNRTDRIRVDTCLATVSVGKRAVRRVATSTRTVESRYIEVLSSERILRVIKANNSNSGAFGVSAASSVIVSTTKIPITGRKGESTSDGYKTTSILRTLNIGVCVRPRGDVGYLSGVGLYFLFTRGCRLSVGCITDIQGRLSVEAVFGVLNPLAGPTKTAVRMLNICRGRLIRPLVSMLGGLKIASTLSICKVSNVSRVSTDSGAFMSRLGSNGAVSCRVSPRLFNVRVTSGRSLINKSTRRGTRVALSVLGNRGKPEEGTILLGSTTNLCITKGIRSLESNISLTTRVVSSNGTLGRLRSFVRFAGD